MWCYRGSRHCTVNGGKMKSKETLLNMITGLLLQFFALLSGMILPRIILSYFGSNINGMIASIEQFLSYVTLIEGGVTGVIAASLYLPLAKKDEKELSSIMVVAKRFYRQMGIIFIVYSLFVSGFFAIKKGNEYGTLFVFLLVIVLSINLSIQYLLSLTLRTLLLADKKAYIISGSQIIIIIMNIVCTVLLVHIYPSIHIIKLISGGLYIIQPIILYMYVKERYNINWHVKPDNRLLKNRWNGFAINIAAFIHNSTDIAILTVMMNFEAVSVYYVYNIVCGGLKQLITSCLSGIAQSLGHSYARGNVEEINIKLDLYEYIVFVLVFFCFSVTILLMTPFVQLYTDGISDANYHQPIFGYLLILSEVFYLVKLPYLDLAYVANKFKEISAAAYIEAITNILLSVYFVYEWGLVGVVVGTVVAMFYRMIFHVNYTRRIIPTRKQYVFYKKIVSFFVTACIGLGISRVFYPIVELTWTNWFVHGIIYCFIIGICMVGLSIICYRKEVTFIRQYIKI